MSDVVGQTMSLGAGDVRRDYLVTGVLRDLPKNSSLHLGIVFRYNSSDFDSVPASFKGWGSMNQQHYVKLREGADATAINRRAPGMGEAHDRAAGHRRQNLVAGRHFGP